MAAPESLWSRFIVCPNSGRRNRKVDIARIVVATYGYALGVAGSLLARTWPLMGPRNSQC